MVLKETIEEYPQPRWLDSVYVRVIRFGKEVNRCFTDLTEGEQKQFLESLDEGGVKRLCLLMAGAVRGIGDIYGLAFVATEDEDGT